MNVSAGLFLCGRALSCRLFCPAIIQTNFVDILFEIDYVAFMGSEDRNNDPTRSFVPLSPGARISHYVIIEKIGAGGMGEVYLAEDTSLNRRVALKFLSLLLSRDDTSRKRFIREAQAVAKLNHPNVVGVYEVGEYQGRPFFAMQNIEGRSLKEHSAEQELPIEEIVALAIQLSEGLQAAHSLGIIHRDIKPSNIIIDSGGRARIVDFGLASMGAPDHLTRSGSTLGTVGYMSPEQAEGKTTDQRGDLFSLGVVLYELITRRNPFVRDSEAATLRAVVEARPEPLARYRSGVPDELQRIIQRLLEKNPDHRYQSAAGLVSDLKRLIQPSSVAAVSSPARRGKRYPYIAGVVIFILAVAGIFWATTRGHRAEKSAPQKQRVMLAVLPFENLGAPEDEYFADGITDAITSRLASIRGLGVISRTSAIQYKHTDKSLPQIASELGVDYILEGTILWDKSGDTDRVRITPQLINASDNTHIWADNYERALTQIFAVQTDIATRVVEALDVTLLEPERRSLQAASTNNLDAYDLYLRAKEYATRSYEEKDFQTAITLLDKALEFDPNYVEALAGLGYVDVEMYLFEFDHTKKRLDSAKALIDRAASLDPDNPDVLFARAMYYYHGLFDYDKALEKVDKLISIAPSRIDSYRILSAIKRRQGKWDEALQNDAKLTKLNPRDAREIFEAGVTQQMVRNYAEAEKLFKRAISLAPDVSMFYSQLAQMYILWNGNVEKSRQLILDAKNNMDPGDATMLLVQCDVFDHKYTEALQRLSGLIYGPFDDSSDYYSTKGYVYEKLGDTLRSKILYDSSLSFLESQPPEILNTFRYKDKLADTYAGLGRIQDALRAAQEAADLVPMDKDAVFGYLALFNQSIILVRVGEYDRGMDLLDYLLSVPGYVSVSWLKLSPDYDVIRDNPRFKALIDKYDRTNHT